MHKWIDANVRKIQAARSHHTSHTSDNMFNFIQGSAHAWKQVNIGQAVLIITWKILPACATKTWILKLWNRGLCSWRRNIWDGQDCWVSVDSWTRHQPWIYESAARPPSNPVQLLQFHISLTSYWFCSTFYSLRSRFKIILSCRGWESSRQIEILVWIFFKGGRRSTGFCIYFLDFNFE